ncbi:hypothetical protein BKA67DRAFT_541032 [Truncatella angustata]|uniref:Uncharacterized protein n=1 Tax=Truncatella angustata TaxID=152316 RepID=A0A9P8UBY9_9PEZI|nr:uncharacterized protein BKA67DRAFT_541032 [Truncatella angustata]KAH6646041.1 hypothetical protein BKA67DRAFT_541032 [Truncatella angustata]
MKLVYDVSLDIAKYLPYQYCLHLSLADETLHDLLYLPLLKHNVNLDLSRIFHVSSSAIDHAIEHQNVVLFARIQDFINPQTDDSMNPKASHLRFEWFKCKSYRCCDALQPLVAFALEHGIPDEVLKDLLGFGVDSHYFDGLNHRPALEYAAQSLNIEAMRRLLQRVNQDRDNESGEKESDLYPGETVTSGSDCPACADDLKQSSDGGRGVWLEQIQRYIVRLLDGINGLLEHSAARYINQSGEPAISRSIDLQTPNSRVFYDEGRDP